MYYPYSLGIFNVTDMVGGWSAGEVCYRIVGEVDSLSGGDE